MSDRPATDAEVLSLIARIEQDGERMEAARCALHKGNARCTGEGKQVAIIAALDAIGWEAPDAHL